MIAFTTDDALIEDVVRVRGERPSAVQATGTPKRRVRRSRHYVETMEFLGAAKRFIRAAGRRVADADEVELAELLALEAVLKDAIQMAVDGQLATGRSWAHIGTAAGTTRGAAFQRWGKK